jgi:phenylpropionate dioxygenase-like ring-hydroxylating dioxygenase large terminal subunit
MQALDYAFDQDKRMVESVQRNMGGERDILKMSPEINRADKAAVRARRILKMLIEGGEQLVCAVADAEAA